VESYLTDALGSVLELRDAAQAQTVAYTYDPYGKTGASAASSNTLKYTGREQDLGDLYYYRNRYYKPSLGRFISEDPIGLAGGENIYAYVGNNPVNLTDPLGLSPAGFQQCSSDNGDCEGQLVLSLAGCRAQSAVCSGGCSIICGRSGPLKPLCMEGCRDVGCKESTDLCIRDAWARYQACKEGKNK
jgi:RHS repeat-associated protein